MEISNQFLISAQLISGKTMFKLKNLPLTISTIVVTSLIVGWGISMVLAWFDPTANPPSDNVFAPINVSSTAQTKAGDLNIGDSMVVINTITADAFLGEINAANVTPGIFASNYTYGNYTFNNSLGGPLLYIDAANARIGIGDTTPDYKLDVSGDIRVTGTIYGTLAEGGAAGGWVDDGTNVRLDTDTDRVGIGTTTPDYQLQVEKSTGEAFIAITSNPSNWSNLLMGDTDDATKGMVVYANDTDRMIFFTNNTEQMTIRSDGDVGIGYANPGTAKLAINGNVGIGTTGPDSKLHVSGGTGSVELIVEADTDNSGEADQPRITLRQDGSYVTGQLGYFDSTNDLKLINNYGEAYVNFDSNGNVGIGTTDPTTAKLVISSSGAAIDVGSQKIINLATPGNASDAANKSYVDSVVGGAEPGIYVNAHECTADGTCETQNIDISDSASAYGRLYFKSNSSVAGVINRGTASSDLYFGETADTGKYIFRSSGDLTIEGNVGIGTSTIGSTLTVDGTIESSGALTVGGNATVAGQNVCRQDGINCPTSIGGADKVNGYGSSPDNSHPGTGLRPFYSWNLGQAYNATAGYSNGISVGSHPGDPNYGFQIVQNMWDDRLYFRRYNYGWQSWFTVIDSGNIGAQSVNYAVSAGDADLLDGQDGTYYLDDTWITTQTCDAGQYLSSVGKTSKTCSAPPDSYPGDIFVNISGDTMSGGLGMGGNNIDNVGTMYANYVQAYTFYARGDTGHNWTPGAGWHTFNTPSGNIQLGPANATWAHIYTDRPNFYFNKNLYVNGTGVCLADRTNCPTDNDTWITTQTCPGGQYLSSVGKTSKTCSAPPGGITCDSCNAQFVNTSGNETMSGSLTVNGGVCVGPYCSANTGRLIVSGSAGEVDFQDRQSAAWSVSDRYVIYHNADVLRFYRGGDLMTLDSGNGGTLTVNKLLVGTIDPIYEIDGKKYATYVSDFAGGVRTETSGVIQLNSEAKYVIDFDDLEKGSDLWLFWETSNKDMDDLAIVISAGFEGKVWYNKQGHKLTIFGDKPGEVSYRLTLPRLDDEEWGNLVVDKE